MRHGPRRWTPLLALLVAACATSEPRVDSPRVRTDPYRVHRLRLPLIDPARYGETIATLDEDSVALIDEWSRLYADAEWLPKLSLLDPELDLVVELSRIVAEIPDPRTDGDAPLAVDLFAGAALDEPLWSQLDACLSAAGYERASFPWPHPHDMYEQSVIVRYLHQPVVVAEFAPGEEAAATRASAWLWRAGLAVGRTGADGRTLHVARELVDAAVECLRSHDLVERVSPSPETKSNADWVIDATSPRRPLRFLVTNRREACMVALDLPDPRVRPDAARRAEVRVLDYGESDWGIDWGLDLLELQGYEDTWLLAPFDSSETYFEVLIVHDPREAADVYFASRGSVWLIWASELLGLLWVHGIDHSCEGSMAWQAWVSEADLHRVRALYGTDPRLWWLLNGWWEW